MWLIDEVFKWLIHVIHSLEPWLTHQSSFICNMMERNNTRYVRDMTHAHTPRLIHTASRCVAVCCSVLQCVAVATTHLRDSFIRECICDMTHLYAPRLICMTHPYGVAMCCSVVQFVAVCCSRRDSSIWLIHTGIYMWHDPFIWAMSHDSFTWLIHMNIWVMPYTDSNGSFTWLIHMRLIYMTHPYGMYMWHDSFIWAVTHSRDSFIWLIHMSHASFNMFIRMWHAGAQQHTVSMCAMTHSHEPWLIYMRHDSLITIYS